MFFYLPVAPSPPSAPCQEKIDIVMWLSLVFNNKEGKIIYCCSLPDIVPSLPEGWPQFKSRLWRRRSCELVKSSSSCVRKAVSHLHQLQDLVDLFYKTERFDEDERLSRQRFSAVSGAVTLIIM